MLLLIEYTKEWNVIYKWYKVGLIVYTKSVIYVKITYRKEKIIYKKLN